MTDAQLAEVLDRVSVYARVSPAHKIRIVEAWQARGKIVAMTGDGVNRRPGPEAGGHRRRHGRHGDGGRQGRGGDDFGG